MSSAGEVVEYEAKWIEISWTCCWCNKKNEPLEMVCHNDDCDCRDMSHTKQHYRCKDCVKTYDVLSVPVKPKN